MFMNTQQIRDIQKELLADALESKVTTFSKLDRIAEDLDFAKVTFVVTNVGFTVIEVIQQQYIPEDLDETCEILIGYTELDELLEYFRQPRGL